MTESVNHGFIIRDYTIADGTQLEIPFLGDFVRMLSSTADLLLGTDDNPPSKFPEGAWFKRPPGQEFHKVVVVNNSGGAVTFEIGLALGDLGYDALTVTADLKVKDPTTGASFSDVVAEAAAIKSALTSVSGNPPAGLLDFSTAVTVTNVGASITVVAAGANVNGVIIWAAQQIGFNGAQIIVGGQVISYVGAASGGTGGTTADRLSGPIFVPAGVAITATAGASCQQTITYEVL